MHPACIRATVRCTWAGGHRVSFSGSTTPGLGVPSQAIQGMESLGTHPLHLHALDARRGGVLPSREIRAVWRNIGGPFQVSRGALWHFRGAHPKNPLSWGTEAGSGPGCTLWTSTTKSSSISGANSHSCDRVCCTIYQWLVREGANIFGSQG
jgi:hypothetical protein